MFIWEISDKRIVLKKTGEPTELLQTKHHTVKKGPLTDAFVDVWKTLRIWCEEFSNLDNDKGQIRQTEMTALFFSLFHVCWIHLPPGIFAISSGCVCSG